MPTSAVEAAAVEKTAAAGTRPSPSARRVHQQLMLQQAAAATVPSAEELELPSSPKVASVSVRLAESSERQVLAEPS